MLCRLLILFRMNIFLFGFLGLDKAFFSNLFRVYTGFINACILSLSQVIFLLRIYIKKILLEFILLPEN